MADNQTKIHLYREMLRIRLIEEKIAEIYPEQEMRCPVHLSIGQEAVSVGVCAHLKKDEYATGDHRSHAQYLAKGGSLKGLLGELYGRATGCCQGKGGSMHLIDLEAGFLGAVPIVASIIPISVGAAFGAALQGKSKVVVPFFGDGAIEEGTFHEALNFASLKKLPVVFVCENNFFSVYSPLSVRQPEGREIYEIAKVFKIESLQGDGNDVLEVHKIAQYAIHKARAGKGPTFLEFKTFRWREHCGPNYDNELGYRNKKEAAEWEKRCPIKRLEGQILKEGLISLQAISKLKAEIQLEIEEAISFTKKSPYPDKKFLLEHVYAETPNPRNADESTRIEVFPSH